MVWIFIWILGFRLLQPNWPYHWQWLIFSGLTLAYCLALLWRNLKHNHREGDPTILPRLGLGNRLSLLRGLFVGLIAGFLFAPWPLGGLAWVIALLYTTASIIDGFDGFVARKANQVTVLGQKLDIEFDALGITVITMLAIGYGQLPAWFILVALARYLFVFGLWWRARANKPIYDLPPSIHRRIMAGMLMGMMTVVLWPIVPAGMSQIAALIIAIPVLLGFIRDWLMSSGRLQPNNPTYLQVQKTLFILMARLMPPLWRLLLAIAMVGILTGLSSILQPLAWQDLLTRWHMPVPGFFAVLLAIVAIIGPILILLGVLGRSAAVLLLFPIGFDIATRGLTGANSLALACTFCIALLGTGMFSLWQPEEVYISRPPGSHEQELEQDDA